MRFARRYDIDKARSQFEQTYVITLLGVFLVVLLWMWVILPMRAPGVWPLLELPSALTGHKAPDTEGDVYISVDAKGRVFFNEELISVAALGTHIAEATRPYGSRSPSNIFVRVDRSTPFRAVRRVIIAAQENHKRNLIFLARARQPESLTWWN
jgi:biopolymer transport protein ExbD